MKNITPVSSVAIQENKFLKLFFATIFIIIIGAIFYKISTLNLLTKENGVVDFTTTLTIGDSNYKNNYKVSIADDDKERSEGLSGTTSLCADCGKLFIFNTEGYYSFWMKDMNYDLDIIFLNKDKYVVNIFKNVKKESYPDKIENSTASMYVLELNSGDVEKNSIKVGDYISF